MDKVFKMKEYTYLSPGVSTPGSSRSSTSSLTVTDHHLERHQDRVKCSGEAVDSYTEGIELSNACRKFYVTRVQVAENIKAKLHTDLKSSGCKSLDKSMGTLRQEVVSLIDQDLTLMRQLLTLNERIEELKWHRKFSGYSPASITTSSNMLGSENHLVSDWDMGGSSSQFSDKLTVSREIEGERDPLHSKYLSPSNLSLFGECVYASTQENLYDTLPPSHNVHKLDLMAESRTSDLGSSDELVNSVTDISYRFSKADSCISSECPSNDSSLRKSDMDSVMREFDSMRLSSRDTRINNVVQTIPTIDIRVHIEDDEDDDDITKKHSHDSGIQDDHNAEMII